VDVRVASLRDQLAVTADEVISEAVTSVMYNDEDRTGDAFSLDWVKEEMEVVLHVGPERSWKVLSEFLTAPRSELVSSMYEFHAEHIADAIANDLEGDARMTLVVARQTRNPKSNKIGPGDFDRAATFDRWREKYRERFRLIFVPVGSRGLVAMSYHIKVTVRDRRVVWLSSGNWKRSSQPLLGPEEWDDPQITSQSGNREWHVVIDSPTLGERFRNHIMADYQQSDVLGGTLEAVEPETLVDVPIRIVEGVVLERVPDRVIPEKTIHRPVRVKPLLTPDREGAVYSKTVLDLVRSAKTQLVFQNQYINITDESGGFIDELVTALIKQSHTLDDVRMILRSDVDGFWDNVSELKRRGLDVNRRIRRLPMTHTKGIVVDGERVLLGSHNWSALGVTLNRDASLLFDDKEIAQYFLGVFDVDWNRASRLSTDEAVVVEGARLAEGAAPPSGFRRMPLSEYLDG
jgi:phosphatidylserine/phosphatidylglycerophosphate/cardiolipin synthase-like enzyme